MDGMNRVIVRLVTQRKDTHCPGEFQAHRWELMSNCDEYNSERRCSSWRRVGNRWLILLHSKISESAT